MSTKCFFNALALPPHLTSFAASERKASRWTVVAALDNTTEKQSPSLNRKCPSLPSLVSSVMLSSSTWGLWHLEDMGLAGGSNSRRVCLWRLYCPLALAALSASWPASIWGGLTYALPHLLGYDGPKISEPGAKTKVSTLTSLLSSILLPVTLKARCWQTLLVLWNKIIKVVLY